MYGVLQSTRTRPIAGPLISTVSCEVPGVPATPLAITAGNTVTPAPLSCGQSPAARSSGLAPIVSDDGSRTPVAANWSWYASPCEVTLPLVASTSISAGPNVGSASEAAHADTTA